MVAYSKTLQKSVTLDKQERTKVTSHDGSIYYVSYVLTLDGRDRYIFTTQSGSLTEIIEQGGK